MVMAIFNFAINFLVDETYLKFELKTEPEKVVYNNFIRKIERLGQQAAPALIQRMIQKKETLYLWDSGDNLDEVGLEVEGLARIGPNSTGYLCQAMLNSSGDSNCDVALRASMADALGRLLPRMSKGIPFGPHNRVIEFISPLYKIKEKKLRPFLISQEVFEFIRDELKIETKKIIFLDLKLIPQCLLLDPIEKYMK